MQSFCYALSSAERHAEGGETLTKQVAAHGYSLFLFELPTLIFFFDFSARLESSFVVLSS